MKANASSYEDAYREFYDKALLEPLPWYRMDSDFMSDTKVRKLLVLGGWEYLGMWQALNSCLAREDGHTFDVSDELGWRFLQAAMGVGGLPVGMDDLRRFVETLVSLGLLDAQMYSESGKLASDRMLREAEAFAQNAANGRVKALKMRRSSK